MELIISQNIHKVLPHHSEEEMCLLTANIKENGVIQPIVVWLGRGIIIDGHARYAIARKFGLPFPIKEMDFASETEAILWVIKTHIGRRNLSIFQKCELVLPYREAIAAEARKRMHQSKHLPKDEIRGETNQILANMVGISGETLRQAAHVMEQGDQETLRRVRKGELSIKRAYDSLRGKMPRQTKKADTLQPAKEAVDDLIVRISEGDVTTKAIIAELRRVSSLIEEAR